MSAIKPNHHPAEWLLNLIVTLLTPMFLAAADGNVPFARQAALQSLEAYRAETQSDFITVAKIIGFGLATLAALSLSMAEDLPVTTILRLHASANASDRSEHRNRALLKQSHASQPQAAPEPDIDEAALANAAAEMQARTAQHLAQFTPAPAAADKQKRDQAGWAASAAAIAAETAAALPTLSPQERQSAAIWIDVLNESAKDFMTGNIAAPLRPANLASPISPTG